jgi:hypothetical protein
MTIRSIAKPPDPTRRLFRSSRRDRRFHREDIAMTHFSLNGAATPLTVIDPQSPDAGCPDQSSPRALAVIEPDMSAARETGALGGRARPRLGVFLRPKWKAV